MSTHAADTNEKILETTTQLVALHGCDGISMRLVGQHIPIAQSVIYHYYADKDALLAAMYRRANQQLGADRALLPKPPTAVERLHNLIQFQFAHAEQVIAVLKYYLHYREMFAHQGTGTLPEKATLHVEEVLAFGKETGDFEFDDLAAESKVIAHAINGYLLEYYPHLPTADSAQQLQSQIVSFAQRALAPRY